MSLSMKSFILFIWDGRSNVGMVYDSDDCSDTICLSLRQSVPCKCFHYLISSFPFPNDNSKQTVVRYVCFLSCFLTLLLFVIGLETDFFILCVQLTMALFSEY